MSSIKRQTAYKCSINHLLNGDYIQQQGLNPNYVDINGVKAARVNILGILVSKEENVLVVDDSTNNLQIMLFEERQKNNNLDVGDLLLIIGKPREHNNKRFLVPEIIKKVKDKDWFEHRKKELSLLNYCCFSEKKKVKSQPEKIVPEIIENYQEKIIGKIEELDGGDGASYQDLLNSLNIEDAEEKVEELIKEGEIFEIKGKLKTL